MPEDVRCRIIRNRERQAQLAKDESSDREHGAANGAATATTNCHIAAAIFDPTELHIDTMDPNVRESWLSTLGNDVRPIPQHFAHTAVPTNINPGPSPPSPTLTASSVSSTPTKKKKENKKKKKSTTVNKIQSAFEGMSLKEADEVDEAEYSM
jgi:hypothetical protein